MATPSEHLRLGSWTDLGQAALGIRLNVFVAEQGVPEEYELDDLDPVSLHAVIDIDGRPAATGRLCPDGRIGRMAVLKAFRGMGLGGKILQALIQEASRRGHRETYLHAQLHALAFYGRYGFVADGPPFDEAGITHRLMHRRQLPHDTPAPNAL